MTFRAYPKFPASITKAAPQLADKDGASREKGIVNAVESATDFFKRKAGNAKPADLMHFLDNAKNEPPPLGDEIY